MCTQKGVVVYLTCAVQGLTTLKELALEPDLTATQRLGLVHVADFNERIPRPEMDLLRAEVRRGFHGSWGSCTETEKD